MPTLIEALRNATRDLADAGIDSPDLDARILLCEAAAIDRVVLLRDPGRLLHPQALERLNALITRRRSREPVSRILGRREFWGLDLLLTPHVLDPRPDTETLVEAALKHVRRKGQLAPRILDLGTGSGAILCALLSECPGALGWGVDLSMEACRVAGENLRRCGFGDRSAVIQGPWGDALAPQAFDLVVSNPPYIETAVISTLEADVRDHDPVLALDGGVDGLTAYRAIAAQLPRLLVPGGTALLEVGKGQAAAVLALMAAVGLIPDGIARDLAGLERVVSATAVARVSGS